MLNWLKNACLQLISLLNEYIFVSTSRSKEVKMDLLRQLMDTFGPSGAEQEVRSLIQKTIKPYVSEIKIDKFGNLIAHKKGQGAKVMLIAHMDEVGLMIHHIDSAGLIKFSPIGGVEPLSLVGQRVKIYTNKKPIEGVITLSEISSGFEDPENSPKLEDLFVDTGLSRGELIKLGIEIGSYLHLHSDNDTLGSNEIICGKALDDRIGCFILMELAKKLKKTKGDLYFVFSVQEELGLYGAKTAVYNIDPAWAVAVDVTAADDRSAHPTLTLGAGPTITIKDADMLGNKCINDWLMGCAKKKKIPYQLEVSDLGTTDALRISLSKGGIPTSVIGVAVRNLHTSIGIANRKDIEQTITILETLLKNPPQACII
ncbi:MAG: M28 family peptidase [Candidatus Nanoarchaeia archaeon]|nr:M28 family peptidase [Candidatus Nanoarchaeia archaeon]